MASAGIPNLLKGAPKAIGISLIGGVLRGLWNALFPGPQWGVFMAGTPNMDIPLSSVVYMDIAGDSQASDYPLQTGSFTNYNKVVNPNLFRVAISCDQNEEYRSLFLQWMEKNVGTTSLFDVVCPEYTWPNATLVSYRISRSSRNGATMLVADCVFQQIRQLPAVYSATNIPDPENQPATPTARVNPLAGEPYSAGGDVAWA